MDKSEITPALVTRLLEEQFPEWADLPITPVELEGWDNTTYRLGDDMSVRLPSAAWYSAQVEKEHRWLPELAGHLPFTIPQPLAKGEPGPTFPRPWSVYRWLPGAYATLDRVDDLVEFAEALGRFLTALHSIPPGDGPPAGKHNFFRGGTVSVWDQHTRSAIEALGDEIDGARATEVWESCLESEWDREPVWIHGDLSASNLLVVDGRLSAVIDFGCSAVGDPACDLAIAWTFFEGPSREAFQAAVPLDAATWQRGRGWALWKALITHAEALQADPPYGDTAGLRFGWRTPAHLVIDDLLGHGAATTGWER